MDENFTTTNSISLDQAAIGHLNGSAKWSQFLAILGFIGIGLMVLLGIAMTSLMSDLPGMPMEGFGLLLGAFYLLLAGLYFFPVYYLFKYSTGMKNAIQQQQSAMVTDALGYLSRHHKFLGIMIIALIGIYILIFFGAIAYAGLSAF